LRTHHICPKCGGHRILLVPDVASTVDDDDQADPIERVIFEAYVCDQCRFTELYAAAPIVPDGKRVRVIDDSDDELYDEWNAPGEPESEEFFESDWPLDEIEITEVSRVEKKPESCHGAKVLLTHIGPRPSDVMGVLRQTLGLTIPSDDWLKNALPYVVLDLISIDAAEGLKTLLEDVGGIVEIQSRKDP
jgi:predicted nucleic-acid-binding Zn-ribbon protein